MSDRRIDDQVEILREELADLDDQVAAGDLDEDTADMLRARYTRQLADLDLSPDADLEDDSDPATSMVRRRLGGRAIVGAALVGIAILVVGVFAVVSLDDRPTDGAEGLAGDVVDGTGPVDLSTITNEQMEQVVAQNPDVIGMRLALARRYFEDGQFDKALDHYFEILDREQNPEALANVGWMTYLSGRPDIAAGYLEAALRVQPDYLPAKWFLANVYVTLGRPDEAAGFLTELADADDIPPEIEDGVSELLAQIAATP
jgi:cytochrome c-type biogenesis protein CcmH/NrfG